MILDVSKILNFQFLYVSVCVKFRPNITWPLLFWLITTAGSNVIQFVTDPTRTVRTDVVRKTVCAAIITHTTATQTLEYMYGSTEVL
jgi:hypothetical protein